MSILALILILFFCVCLGSSIPTSAVENTDVKEKSLRDCRIRSSKKYRIASPTDLPNCSTVVPPKVTYLQQVKLKRPGKNDRKCIAVVRKLKDGTVVLNPNGFDYGSIPSLKKMTQKEADELWKTKNGKSVNANVVTYKLTPFYSEEPVFIDLIFKKNGVRKYQIRSTIISSSKWKEV